MADAQDRQAILDEFRTVSGADEVQATRYLEANGWDVVAATGSYFQDMDEDERSAERSGQPPSTAPQEPAYTGPRTLDGRPAPQAATRGSRASAPQRKKKGVATLGSLGGGSHPHDDDDDDDEDYNDDEDGDDDNGRGNLFAGGEKSGLAVQDPNQEGGTRKLMNDILAKAKANATSQEPAESAGPSRRSHFRGTGMTLGGEGEESREIPDPRGPTPASELPVEERVLHIWSDGFSIEDGELRRFDDPANRMDVQMIRAGQVPHHLMNVQPGQPVDVRVHPHETEYVPQPKKYKPFSGSGRRLGSPVPGDGSSSSTQQAPGPSTLSTTSTAPSTAVPTVDSSQPTVMIRIQMPDGTRLPARFNTTQTLDDVYGFIQSASAETQNRPWVLATTFPNKEHTDKSLALGDVPEFKKGGTAVVKWT